MAGTRRMARPTGSCSEGPVSVEPQAQTGRRSRTSSPRRRTFPPDPAFVAQANATAALYDEADADPIAFWDRPGPGAAVAGPSRYDQVLDWDLPFAKWFAGGELNVAYNCVDRHVEAGLGDKVAYHWIGEPGDTRTLTYADLQRESSKAANALLELGVRKGDRVAIYMPMIPELPIAMLACARIGAPHTVVFGGFSAEALSGRINDCGAKVADHRRRRLAAGQEGRPQAPRRRGGRGHADDRARARRRPARRRRPHGRRAATTGGTRSSTASREACAAGPGRERAHALPALHVGDDREAEGDPPHLGRVPRSARRSPTGPCSTSSPTTSTGARRTSAG